MLMMPTVVARRIPPEMLMPDADAPASAACYDVIRLDAGVVAADMSD